MKKAFFSNKNLIGLVSFPEKAESDNTKLKIDMEIRSPDGGKVKELEITDLKELQKNFSNVTLSPKDEILIKGKKIPTKAT